MKDPSIILRIEDTLAESRMRGNRPTKLYLGKEEYRLLANYCDSMMMLTRWSLSDTKPSDEKLRPKYGGLWVYTVDSDNHLECA